MAACGGARPGPAKGRSRSTAASTSRPPSRWSPRSSRRPASRSTSATTTRTPSPTRSSPRRRTRAPMSSTPRTRRRWSTCRRRACWPASTPRPWPRRRAEYNSPQGDWVGVSARVSVLIYNPSLISKSQLPTTVLQLANPKYKGKLAFAAGETDFQPIVTSVARTYGTGRRAAVAGGHQGQRRQPRLPRQRDHRRRGQPRRGRVRRRQPVLLVPDAGRARGGQRALAITYFAPHDPGYVLDVSGAAVLKSSKHQAAAQKFLAFLVSTAGPGDHRPLDQLRVPARRTGCTTAAPETPFDQLQPNPITIAELGDGSTAIALLQQGRHAVTPVPATGPRSARHRRSGGPRPPPADAPARPPAARGAGGSAAAGCSRVSVVVAVVLIVPLAFLLVEAHGAGARRSRT